MLNGLQFVIRHVNDIAAARAFYTEKIGLEVLSESDGFVQFAAPNGATYAVSRTRNPDDLPIELWWVVDDADAAYAELEAKGVEITIPLSNEPFGRTFAIKDTTGGYCHILQLPG